MVYSKPKIYIAGPYTLGDTAANVKNAMAAFNQLMELGFAPFEPHLTHFQHICFPQSYETWLAYCFEWVVACDGLLRLPGESAGADQEISVARDHDIPVFHNMDELTSYWQNWIDRS